METKGYTTKFRIGDLLMQDGGCMSMGVVREIKISNLANLTGVIHYVVEANGHKRELAEHVAILIKPSPPTELTEYYADPITKRSKNKRSKNKRGGYERM